MRIRLLAAGCWALAAIGAPAVGGAEAALAAPAEIDAVRIRADRDLPGLPVASQRRIIESIRRGSGPNGHRVWAWFAPADEPALAGLNPDFLERLHGPSRPGSEANCYFTSLFALGIVGLPERYMDLPEYDSWVGSRFAPVDPADEEAWSAGDVLRLRRARGGVDTHSVVYVGRLKGDRFTHLVLSKNGPGDGHYLLQDLWDLKNLIYVGSRVAAVYRPR